jgi:serine protease Do
VPDCPCQRFQPGDTLARPCRHRPRWSLAILLVSLLAGPAVARAIEAADPPASFASVARAARSASIVIRADDTDLLAERSGPAAGIIVDPRGLAVTSARAVLQSRAFEVELVDGTPVDATLLALDRKSDVAVLKLEAGVTVWPFLPLGDSDRVTTGDWIIAVSAPLGLEGTVTAGVITASPRTDDNVVVAGFLQTDAALGSDSAGVPLVSLDGRVVGFGIGFAAAGVGYARPSNVVRRIYLELLERGRVIRPWLGVSTQTLTVRLARALGVRDATGVLIADVAPGGPGARAGLRSGDVVVALDAVPVASRAQLERAVDALAPGRTARLGIRRAAARLSVEVRIGEEPDESQLSAALARARELLGIEAAPLTPTMGVVIADLEASSPAERAGLEPGDILREVNHRPMRTLADFEAAVGSLGRNTGVLILVQRADVALYVVIDPQRGRSLR